MPDYPYESVSLRQLIHMGVFPYGSWSCCRLIFLVPAYLFGAGLPF